MNFEFLTTVFAPIILIAPAYLSAVLSIKVQLSTRLFPPLKPIAPPELYLPASAVGWSSPLATLLMKVELYT